jgi:enoyl-CoA hydratase
MTPLRLFRRLCSSAPRVVLVSRKGPVFTVTINRPEVRNAVDRRTAEALAAAFRDFEADETLRVAVLCGAGGNFCSGADLKAVKSGDPALVNRLSTTGDGPMGPSRMSLSKPVIAAVSGHAVAGGLELAVWCDLRVCEEDSVFGVFCRRWGVPLIDGGTVRLPRLVGGSRAMDMILTGRPVGAAEAKEIGLANRVVAKGRAVEEAQALAEEIAAFPWDCVVADRASARQAEEQLLRYEYANAQGVLEKMLPGVSRFVQGEGRGGEFGKKKGGGG